MHSSNRIPRVCVTSVRKWCSPPLTSSKTASHPRYSRSAQHSTARFALFQSALHFPPHPDYTVANIGTQEHTENRYIHSFRHKPHYSATRTQAGSRLAQRLFSTQYLDRSNGYVISVINTWQTIWHVLAKKKFVFERRWLLCTASREGVKSRAWHHRPTCYLLNACMHSLLSRYLHVQ